MPECNGMEMCEEWLYHMGVPEEKIPEMAAAATTIPVHMPYITSYFMPRALGDKPKVVPDHSKNLAFIGNFAETPRDTVFTTEYSVRTAMEAVYTLLDIDRGVPEVFASAFDVRMLMNAMYYLNDQKKLEELDLPVAEKLDVYPGEDIQAAIEKAGNRWVVLKKGLHTIRQPLRLESGTKLCGEGRKSILMLESDCVGPTIINATLDMHDIVLQNFVVEGATKAETGFDPNYERGLRLYWYAPSREGIILLSDSTHKMQNISLQNVTVRNCTKNGVYIAGASNITIDRCDFDNNGSNVVPGPGFHHNMYLSHVTKVDVTDSRFDSSLWGNGLHITFGSNIRITGNELARNALSGIYCAESDGVGISDNLLEGNNIAGICVEQLMDACTQIDISGNLIQYNALAGIQSIGNNSIGMRDNCELGN